MGELETGIYNELKRNKFSGIPKLNGEDVGNVWESVSRFIERQMLSQKGVNIVGFGTFTFSQRSVEVGSRKHVVLLRPVFQLAEKFAQTHALNYTKHYVTGQIPVVALNFTAIASETPFPRDTVETCIKETLQALSRSLHVKRNVEFIFSGIGCLSMRDSRVKMKFFKEFVTSIDSSGELVDALRNRPDTSDSVLSNLVTPRPSTGNTVILPRVTLSPDDGNQDENNRCESRNEKIRSPTKSFNPMATIDEVNERERLTTPMIPRSPKRDPTPIPCEPDNPDQVPQRPPSASRSSRLRHLSQPIPRSPSGLRPNQSPVKKDVRISMSADIRLTSARVDEDVDSKVVLPSPRLNSSGCSHNNKAGQELCYLCHQRARKNNPIYLHDEIKKREYEEEKLLQQYQDKKDDNAILNQQAKEFSNRKLNQESAAFNLGVAEAIKETKNSRSTNFNRSYLFRQRAATPPHYLKQALYAGELAKQVKEKENVFQQRKSDKDFLERLEQVQLAEDLARQREQYLQEKKQKNDAYCQDLQTQVQFKPLPIPAAEPDSLGPVFGVHDACPEKMREQRDRARQLYQEQLAMVADKKRAAILRDITTQREQSEMLERTKLALIQERNDQFRDAIQMRQALEKSWNETHRRKLQREQEEHDRSHSPAVLIQEQCDKYHRCNQCGRRPWNCGESNIWRESRYIAGSRLIV